MLGPVEVRTGGGKLPLGRPQQRTVLAALAAEVGRVVPVEVLVDRVWGEDPPVRARRTLHSHITRIRRVLDNIGAEAANSPQLVFRSGGYALETAPDQIDVHRFRRKVRDAGQPQMAANAQVALFRDALALWLGEPLSGLAGTWVEHTRESWRLEWLDAVVSWADAELRVKNPSPVIMHLTELVRDYPLMERLAEMLIRALYAAGRSAEALDRYAAVRRGLVETLGVEPGAALRTLHWTVLRGEPDPAAVRPEATESRSTPQSLAVPNVPIPRPASAVSPTTVRPVVPAQLPMDVRTLTGRHTELARLDGIVDVTGEFNGVAICALWGTAGVGKTALAVHWAHRMAARFPDGQLYVNLRGFALGTNPVSPAAAIRGFLDALQVPPQRIPANLDAQAALYRSLIAGRRVLVVLDNARDAEQVRPLLPGSSGSVVLITSRHQLRGLVVGEGAQPLPVGELSPDGARALLASRLGTERVAAEPAAVEGIITRCAGLPLALAIVAARAATHPHLTLGVLAAELDQACGSLDAFTSQDLATDVRAVFSWTYHTLTPGAARLFRLLGLHPGPDVSLPAAAHLAGVRLDEARALLDELTRTHMLTEHKPGRFTFHDLLRAYATELAMEVDPPGPRRSAIRRIFEYYLHNAYSRAVLLEPHDATVTLDPACTKVELEPVNDVQQALAWFAAEHAILLAVIRQADEAGINAELWKLAHALVGYLNRRGHWRDQVTVQRTALDTALQLNDRVGQAYAHRGLGLAFAWLGQYDEAYARCRASLDLFEEIGGFGEQALAHLGMARVFERQGRHGEALRHDQAALTLSQITGDWPGQASSLNNVGWSHAMLGDYAQALEYCERALLLSRDIDDLHGQAAILDSLGYIHHHLGYRAQAIECYRQAIERNLEAGSRYGQAESLDHLGDTQLADGNARAAEEAWQRALVILRDLDHPEAAEVRRKLRDLALSLSARDGALDEASCAAANDDHGSARAGETAGQDW